MMIAPRSNVEVFRRFGQWRREVYCQHHVRDVVGDIF